MAVKISKILFMIFVKKSTIVNNFGHNNQKQILNAFREWRVDSFVVLSFMKTLLSLYCAMCLGTALHHETVLISNKVTEIFQSGLISYF